MVAAVEITESRRVAGGDVGGGDLGLDDAEVATAKATAAVEVLLLDTPQQLNKTKPRDCFRYKIINEFIANCVFITLLMPFSSGRL